MTSNLIHVRDKSTGHEYVIPERLFNSEAHTKTNKPALGRDGAPVPTKFKTSVDKAASKKKTQAGQKANPTEENS